MVLKLILFFCLPIFIFLFAFCCTQSSSSTKESFEQFKVYCEEKFAAQSNVPQENSESQDELLSPATRIVRRSRIGKKRKSPSSPDSQEAEAEAGDDFNVDLSDSEARIAFGIF